MLHESLLESTKSKLANCKLIDKNKKAVALSV